MTGPLNDHCFLVGRQTAVSAQDAFPQPDGVPGENMLFGEAGLDRNRTHVPQHTLAVEGITHQDHVFVDLVTVDDHVVLSDRLHEPGVQPLVSEAADKAQGQGGLAHVLPGRGDVQWFQFHALLLQETATSIRVAVFAIFPQHFTVLVPGHKIVRQDEPRCKPAALKFRLDWPLCRLIISLA